MSPMRTLSQLPFSAMLAVATIATSAGAQSANGTISGTLALEEATWVITSADRTDISSGWTATDAGYDVRIVGTPGAGADSLSGALVVEFSAEGGPTRLEASDVSVAYHKPNADAVWRGKAQMSRSISRRWILSEKT
ncbi:hypothetical protein [Roseovarius sp. E0-M6]|uniref:hypothetical protein n=1 Tax=Roseovarius sp. E0-M6 TaxID=3127118 RepID=UPI0030101FB4